MTKMCRDMDHRYHKLAEEQDATICWRHFMEGMICQGLREMQEMYTMIEGSNVTGEEWAMCVKVKLLETKKDKG